MNNGSSHAARRARKPALSGRFGRHTFAETRGPGTRCLRLAREAAVAGWSPRQDENINPREISRCRSAVSDRHWSRRPAVYRFEFPVSRPPAANAVPGETVEVSPEWLGEVHQSHPETECRHWLFRSCLCAECEHQ